MRAQLRRCIRNFRGQMPRYLRSPLTGYAAGIPGRAQTCSLRFWRPLLHHLSYGNIKRRPWNRTSRVYTRTALHIALRRPYKNSSGSPPGLLVGAHPVGKSTHTLRDSKLSFVAREVKRAALWGMSPCAIWCETVDSTRAERGGARPPPDTQIRRPVNGAVPKSSIEAARETLVICAYGQHRAGTFGGCIASVGLFGSADITTIPPIPLRCR